MNCKEEYSAKLCTPEEAVKCVKSGDWVDYITGVAFPASLDAALAALRGAKLSVPCKAVLTASNRGWTLDALIGELLREHEAMHKREENPRGARRPKKNTREG